MRLSNRNKDGVFRFLKTVLVLIVLGCLSLFLLDYYHFHILGWERAWLIVLPIILLVIFYLRGRPIFEYDSDGEALNFKNRHSVALLGKPLSDEFPKYKLIGFDIVNAVVFRRLYIRLSSRKANATTLRYDISYLSAREVADLRLSLGKILKTNIETGKPTNGTGE